MSEKTRLIVVDDEPELCAMLAEYLGKHGYRIRTAGNGQMLDELLRVEPADLVLLDVNMPGEDGFSIARRLRQSSPVAIIMLTAADDVVDRVVGLEIGADDYVTKPFDLRELRARVRSVLRRAEAPVPAQAGGAVADGAGERVFFGSMMLDLASRRLSRPDGEELKLTAMEFDLLCAFARNPNRVLSRDRLLDLAHNREIEPFDRSIDIRITRIRRKIEDDPAHPQIIKTVRGAGYMFVQPKP